MTVIPGVHSTPARCRPMAALPVWAALAAVIVVLHTAGGALPAPPLGSPSAWSRWMSGRDPVVAAFAVVRLAALAGVWYGLAVSAAGVGLRLMSAVRLASFVDRLTVVPLRRLVVATVAVGITTGPVGVTAARAATPAEVTTTTAAPATTEFTTTTGAPTTTVQGPPTTITMHLVAPAADSGPPPTSPDQASTTTPAPGAPSPVPSASDAPVAGGSATWTVRPGQCFWSIAEAELARARGRRPTAAEIVPYWHRLIEVNRAALADPANADLVFAGQVFVLPEA
ncbi:MAG: LysM peptidoglycan-binding domain-containing protein [Acidimicrobiales bacterium]